MNKQPKNGTFVRPTSMGAALAAASQQFRTANHPVSVAVRRKIRSIPDDRYAVGTGISVLERSHSPKKEKVRHVEADAVAIGMAIGMAAKAKRMMSEALDKAGSHE